MVNYDNRNTARYLTTMASKLTSSFGYEYNFVSKPDDDLKCFICLAVARDPWQHGKCGSLFCEKCLNKHGKEKPCPECGKGPQYMEDSRGKRKVNALRVKCDNFKEGCGWEGTVGTLDKHVTNCGFTPVPCPQGCTSQVIMRKNMTRHVKELCMKRPYKCQHCGLIDAYKTITHVHDDECPEKVLPCFNPGCSETMKRRNRENHLKNHCQYTVISCKYKNIGCDVKMKRKDMGAHEQDDKAHLHQALNTVVKLQDDLQSATESIASMKEENNIMAVQLKSAIKSVKKENDNRSVQLQLAIVSVKEENEIMADQLKSAIISVKKKNDDRNEKLRSAIVSVMEKNDRNADSVVELKKECNDMAARLTMKERSENMADKLKEEKRVFKLKQYEKKKNANETFNSQSFYTAADGYKMQIEVYPNGDGIVQGTHISMYVSIMEGDNDDNLNWPFVGTVKFELLNQLEDKNHHQMTLPLDEEDNARTNDECWGLPEFISHSELSCNPVKKIQYLKDDTLYFRVSVEVCGHKPWLECTLK